MRAVEVLAGYVSCEQLAAAIELVFGGVFCYNMTSGYQRKNQPDRGLRIASGSSRAMEGSYKMSMTRDAYAKEVLRVAQAVLQTGEIAVCPHEGCDESLSIVKQGVFSTRSVFCPVHGHIFQEQKTEPFSKLDWNKVPVSPVDDDEDELECEEEMFDADYEAYHDSDI